MLEFKSHRHEPGFDACVRCWTSSKALRVRQDIPCRVPDDSLHRGEEEYLEWRGNPGYFYFCSKCDFCVQIGVDGACGQYQVHECRHGNRGMAELLSPLEVIDVGLRALHFKPRDPYREHRESLRGIEVVDLVPDNDFGDAWATATWEEL